MKNNIIIFLFITFCVPAFYAQTTADDYFHTAANLYVNANKKEAKQVISEGINQFPNNAKLKNMANAIDKLPDQPPPQQNQQQQNQNNNDKNQQEQQQQQQMSKQEAQQLLDALSQDEQQTQQNARKVQHKSTPQSDKDW